MYLVKSTRDYEKSYNKIQKSGISKKILDDLDRAINILASGVRLSPKYSDHQLTGNLAGYRECYIRPDLLLIYRIDNDELILILASLGSHSELFS